MAGLNFRNWSVLKISEWKITRNHKFTCRPFLVAVWLWLETYSFERACSISHSELCSLFFQKVLVLEQWASKAPKSDISPVHLLTTKLEVQVLICTGSLHCFRCRAFIASSRVKSDRDKRWSTFQFFNRSNVTVVSEIQLFSFMKLISKLTDSVFIRFVVISSFSELQLIKHRLSEGIRRAFPPIFPIPLPKEREMCVNWIFMCSASLLLCASEANGY